MLRWSSSPMVRTLLWLAFCGQLAAAFWKARPWLTADSAVYLELARNLGRLGFGTVTSLGFQADALRPPGYPMILHALVEQAHMPIALLVAMQLGIYAASIIAIDRFVRSKGDSSNLFLFLAAIYPFGAMYSAAVMTEAWATLCLTIIGLLILRDKVDWKTLVLAGYVGGVASLIRSDFLILPIFIGGIAAWHGRKSRSMLAGLERFCLPIAAAFIPVAPYAYWNQQNFSTFSPKPVAAAIGNSLYYSTWQARLPQDDLNALYQGRVTPKAEASGLAQEVRTLNRSFGAPVNAAPFNPASYPTSELQIRSTQVFKSAAIERIKADPLAYGRHVVSNVWRLWNTSIYPPGTPALVEIALRLISAGVFLLGIAGIWLARAKFAAVGSRAAVVLLYPMVVHVLLHTEARYTAAARPLLLLYASVAMLWVLKRFYHWAIKRSGRQWPDSASMKEAA